MLKSYTNKDFGDPGKKIINSLEDIFDEKISQLIVESYDIESMKKFKKELINIPNIKISNKSRNPKDSNKILFYDITNKDVSKGNAIKILCDYLKIDINKTMAIGDSDNDIEMLQVSNVKIAMSNATDNLKKVANFVTLSNDQEGVAVVLEQLYDELIRQE